MKEDDIPLYEGNGIKLYASKIGHRVPAYFLNMEVATPSKESPAEKMTLQCKLHESYDQEEPSLEDWSNFFSNTREKPAAAKPEKVKRPPEREAKARDMQIAVEIHARRSQLQEFDHHYRHHGWEKSDTLPYRAMLLANNAEKASADSLASTMRNHGLLSIYDDKTADKLQGYIVKFHDMVMQASKELDTKLGANRQDTIAVTEEMVDAALPELEALKLTLGNHAGKEKGRQPPRRGKA